MCPFSHKSVSVVTHWSQVRRPGIKVFNFTPMLFSWVELRAPLQRWQIMSPWTSVWVQGHYHAGTGLGTLVPVKRNCNDTAYKDIWYNCVLPTLWQFEQEPFMGVIVKCPYGHIVYLCRVYIYQQDAYKYIQEHSWLLLDQREHLVWLQVISLISEQVVRSI